MPTYPSTSDQEIIFTKPSNPITSTKAHDYCGQGGYRHQYAHHRDFVLAWSSHLAEFFAEQLVDGAGGRRYRLIAIQSRVQRESVSGPKSHMRYSKRYCWERVEANSPDANPPTCDNVPTVHHLAVLSRRGSPHPWGSDETSSHLVEAVAEAPSQNALRV